MAKKQTNDEQETVPETRQKDFKLTANADIGIICAGCGATFNGKAERSLEVVKMFNAHSHTVVKVGIDV